MTATVAERLDAGVEDSRFLAPVNPARSLVVPDFVPTQWARTKSNMRGPSSEALQAELRRLQQGPAAVERARTLQVLLASLEGLTFTEAAEILDQKPRRLAEMVHGRRPIPGSMQKRLDDLGEILTNLHEVLEPSAFKRWLNVEVPQLRGGSPLEAIKRGRMRDVVALARSYRHRSFA